MLPSSAETPRAISHDMRLSRSPGWGGTPFSPVLREITAGHRNVCASAVYGRVEHLDKRCLIGDRRMSLARIRGNALRAQAGSRGPGSVSRSGTPYDVLRVDDLPGFRTEHLGVERATMPCLSWSSSQTMASDGHICPISLSGGSISSSATGSRKYSLKSWPSRVLSLKATGGIWAFVSVDPNAPAEVAEHVSRERSAVRGK